MRSDPSSQPEAYMREFCAAWAGGDVAHIATYLAPDVEWENVPIGIIHGREAAMVRISQAFAKARHIEWQLSAIATAADGAVLTERVDILTLPHAEVRLRIMGLFRVGAEGIMLWRDYFDATSYIRDLEQGETGVGA